MVSGNRFFKDILLYCSYLGDSQTTIGDKRGVRVYTNTRIDLEALKTEGVNLKGLSLYADDGGIQEVLNDREPNTGNTCNTGYMKLGIAAQKKGLKLPVLPVPPVSDNSEEKFTMSMKEWNSWGAESLRKGEIRKVGTAEYVRVKKEGSQHE